MFAPHHLSGILGALPDPAFVLTRSGRYAGVFGGSDERYFHAGRKLIGQTLHTVFSSEKANWFLNEIKTALQTKTLHIVEYELAESDLKSLPASLTLDSHWFEGRVRALDFQVEGEDAVLWCVSHLTARRRLEEQLKTMSETDHLTGLWNRQHFYKIAALEQERARRFGHPFALLMVDINQFKTVNDRHGNAVGDIVLSEMARLVVSCIRRSDVAIRWDGDEFAILMPHGNQEAASHVAERIRLCLHNHVFVQGVKLSICGGYGEWAIATETIDELLSRVNQAVRQAKKEGESRCVAAIE